LDLAQQDYERERSLWSQGISAKQDYQRAYNAYRQAQIQVKQHVHVLVPLVQLLDQVVVIR
jgi:multidrug resistance efflux pump